MIDCGVGDIIPTVNHNMLVYAEWVRSGGGNEMEDTNRENCILKHKIEGLHTHMNNVFFLVQT